MQTVGRENFYSAINSVCAWD